MPPPRSPKHSIDPEVREILRAEAEREARLRGKTGGTDGAATQAQYESHPPPATQNQPARPPLKPSRNAAGVETVRSDYGGNTWYESDDGWDAPTTIAKALAARKRALRKRNRIQLGFVIGLALGALAAAIYIEADRLATLIPEAAPYLEIYTAQVNNLRVILEDNGQIVGAWMQNQLDAIE
jgi:hypothetical protein